MAPRRSIVVLLVALIGISLVSAVRVHNKTRNTICIGITTMPRYPSGFAAQLGLTANMAAYTAIDVVNNDSTILPDATLVPFEVVSYGVPGLGTLASYTMAAHNCTIIIGDPSSGSNIQSAVMSGYEKVPQICGNCGSPVLSNPPIYPYFFRTFYMGFVGGVVSVVRGFGWGKIAIAYSLDVLSSSVAQWIVNDAAAYNIEILTIQAFQISGSAYGNTTAMQQEMIPIYQSIKASNARIIVLITSADIIDWVFYGAVSYGFKGSQYAWCSTQPMGSSGMNSTQIDSAYGNGTHVFSRSVLVPNFYMYYNYNTSIFRTFNTTYRSEVAYRYPGSAASITSWLSADGSVPFDTAVRVYDATLAIIHTWDRILNQLGLDASYIPQLTKQGVFTPAEVTNTQYLGIGTLPVSFDNTGSEIFTGVILQNYGPTIYAPAYNMVAIGTYTATGINLTMTPDWTTSNGLPPLDHPQYAPDLFMFWNADSGTDSVAIIFGVLYGIHVLAAFASFFMVIVNRNKSEISRTGLVYYMVVTFGTLLVAIEGLFDLSGSSVVCELDAWLLGLGITAVLSMVMVKIGRVFRMGRNKKLMERQYKNAHFLISFAVTWTIQIILLIVWAATQSSAMTTTYTDTTYSYQCVNTLGNPTGITIVLYIYIGLLVLGSLVIGFCRKQVPPEEDREATYVVMALLNMGLCMGLELWQVTNTNMPVRMRSLLRLIIQWIGLFATQNLLVTLDLLHAVRSEKGSDTHSISTTRGGTTTKKPLLRPQNTQSVSNVDLFTSADVIWCKKGIFGQWSQASIQFCKYYKPFLKVTDEGDKGCGFHVPLSKISGVDMHMVETDSFVATLDGSKYTFQTENGDIASKFTSLLGTQKPTPGSGTV
ncbi:periplasmic binding protein-like I [Polychytrium aggregatum]|uniref:periplasmic binding protein-like I n=1 Tax=Polychytrium aggregatum TaxID=110093 RepID=UPI0022FF215E|nr:periplasmic binding protein-like I [Polychytrium aggregatum]KAI9205055.1 periplasmic binding protein-like I [Polychytrium aggregatum]